MDLDPENGKEKMASEIDGQRKRDNSLEKSLQPEVVGKYQENHLREKRVLQNELYSTI
jgi:hypothetical protein